MLKKFVEGSKEDWVISFEMYMGRAVKAEEIVKVFHDLIMILG